MCERAFLFFILFPPLLVPVKKKKRKDMKKENRKHTCIASLSYRIPMRVSCWLLLRLFLLLLLFLIALDGKSVTREVAWSGHHANILNRTYVRVCAGRSLRRTNEVLCLFCSLAF